MITILLLSFSSFGVHYTRSFLTIFSAYLIKDGLFSPAGYGALLSVMAFSSVFVPLYFGYLASRTAKSYQIMIILLSIVLFSQFVFVWAIAARSFLLEIVAWSIFGLCASSISSMQRAITSQHFLYDQGMGTGFYISLANSSKVLGKLSVAPTMDWLKSCSKAAMVPVLASLASWLSFWAFLPFPAYYSYSNIPSSEDEEEEGDIEEENMVNPFLIRSRRNNVINDIEQGLYQQFTGDFFVLAIVHACYLSMSHTLISFIPHYASVKWQWSTAEVGYAAALPSLVAIFMAPLIGFYADQLGEYLPLCLISGVIATAAFFMLQMGIASAIPCLLVFTIGSVALSTLVLAAISKIVERGQMPLAFAIIEVFDASCSFFCNACFTSLYELTGSYTGSMFFLLLVAFIGAFLLLMLLFTKTQDRPSFDAIHYFSFLH